MRTDKGKDHDAAQTPTFDTGRGQTGRSFPLRSVSKDRRLRLGVRSARPTAAKASGPARGNRSKPGKAADCSLRAGLRPALRVPRSKQTAAGTRTKSVASGPKIRPSTFGQRPHASTVAVRSFVASREKAGTNFRSRKRKLPRANWASLRAFGWHEGTAALSEK